ncbi:hypothetical protein ACGLZM_004941 [Klebsiella pneumoniae]
MLKSLINGNTTTPTMLAKEIVFFHAMENMPLLRYRAFSARPA